MTGTCRQWVRTVRNHPSIVVWRPADGVMPPQAPRDDMIVRYTEQVRAEDGTRPVVLDFDGTDIISHSQSPVKDPRNPNGEYDDGSVIAQKLAASTKPVLTKEIYGGFQNADKMGAFFRQFYEKSWTGQGTGVIVQHLPLIDRRSLFEISWLSESGAGNRDTGQIPEATLPDWCDPSQPLWTPGPYSKLFAQLYQQYVKRKPAAARRLNESELLVSGLEPDELAILLPRDPETVEAIGVRADGKGAAWIMAPAAGEYRLVSDAGSRPVHVRAQTLPDKPGYDYVERITLPAK
jgi:hypothetical protein